MLKRMLAGVILGMLVSSVAYSNCVYVKDSYGRVVKCCVYGPSGSETVLCN